MTVALPRVTVGTIEWLFEKRVPSFWSRYRFGVSVALIESGRRPSTTKTSVSGLGVCAGASEATAVSETRLTIAPSAARRALRLSMARQPIRRRVVACEGVVTARR